MHALELTYPNADNLHTCRHRLLQTCKQALLHACTDANKFSCIHAHIHTNTFPACIVALDLQAAHMFLQEPEYSNNNSLLLPSAAIYMYLQV